MIFDKKYSYKHVCNKRRAKENLHPLLGAEGGNSNKGWGKRWEDEVFNAFFASVFNNKTMCSQGTQPPELEDRDGEQNEALIIQSEVVSNLLYHLDTHKSIGLDRIHSMLLRELAEVLTKRLSTIYHQSCLTEEVSQLAGG